MTDIDNIIDRLGVDLLRELRAIAWFCDSASDGRMALIPSDRYRWYIPGGRMETLTSTGCVRLARHSYCETIQGYRPSIRMAQIGRQVLVRARALRLPIEIDDAEGEDAA